MLTGNLSPRTSTVTNVKAIKNWYMWLFRMITPLKLRLRNRAELVCARSNESTENVCVSSSNELLGKRDAWRETDGRLML